MPETLVPPNGQHYPRKYRADRNYAEQYQACYDAKVCRTGRIEFRFYVGIGTSSRNQNDQRNESTHDQNSRRGG